MTVEEPRPPRSRGERLADVAARGWRLALTAVGAPDGLLVDNGSLVTAPLSARTRQVAEALERAGHLVNELEAEVQARSKLIEALAAEAEQAEQRAEDAVRRAAMGEEQAKAVDAYLDRALKNRISSFERSARRREWGLATVVAFIVGIACILVAHFVFGF
jgi:hypothetical protein